jgi:gliding motility-associated-like protein
MSQRILLLISSFFIFNVSIHSQTFNQPEPGTCGMNCDAPLNGNGTLGQIYNNSACGLNFVTQSNRIGKRFSPQGTGNPSTFPISGIPPCATGGGIIKAFLWAGTSGNGAAMTVSITNPQGVTQAFPMQVVGSGPDKCWGYSGSHTYRADVTSIITGNGNYIMSGFLLGPGTNDVDGATLMIIYQDPQATYKGHIVIHDGAVIINGGTTTQTVTGIAACANSINARAFSCIADLQMAGTLTMNGTPAPFTFNWWNYTQVNTNVTNGQNTSNFTMSSGGDCYNFAMAGIYYQTNTCQTCPLAQASLILNTTSVNTNCMGNNGSASVTATGAPGPYAYLWSTGATTQSISNLSPGTYTVTVSANNGCISNSATVTVLNVGAAVNITNVMTPPSCGGGNDGSIALTVTGGSPPFNYSWNPNVGNTPTVTNLTAGNYVVTISDELGCTSTALITVTEPPPLVIQPAQTNVSCNGGNNGSATAMVTGGTGTYNYVWTPVASTNPSVTGLGVGSYTVTVGDANGCTTSYTFNITDPAALQISFPTASDPLCHGSADGTITASASGGTSPYNYVWSNAATGATITGLLAGTYTVTVTDANNCILTSSVTINNPDPLFASITSVTNVSCFGLSDGIINASVVGGTLPYTIAWTPTGGNTQIANGLPTGSYLMTVTDANGCIDTVSAFVNQPPLLTVDIVNSTDASCYGYSDGSAAALIAGGVSPVYTVNWSPVGGNGPVASQIPGGFYTINVLDQNNCSASDTITIGQPALFIVDASVTDNQLCFGESTDLSSITAGGIGTLDFMWNNSQPTQNLTVTPNQTQYHVIAVTDDNNCIAWDSVLVVVSPIPVAGFTGGQACEGLVSTFTNTTTVATGSIATYQWDFGDGVGFSNTMNPTYTYLADGTYNVTLNVVSDMGCTSTITLPISIYEVPTVTFNVDNAIGCVTHCVGFTDLTVMTTSTIAMWDWQANGQQIGSSSNLNYCFTNPGSYDIGLFIQTDKGCVASTTINGLVTVHPNPVANFTVSSLVLQLSDPIAEFTDQSLLATTWLWDFGDGNTSNVQNPMHIYGDTGVYCANLTVSTPFGCTDSQIMCLTVDPEFNLYLPNSFTPNGDKKNDIFNVAGMGLLEAKMLIFNRWGQLIYETVNIDQGWNGYINNGDVLAPQGVYVYRIEITDYKGDFYTFIGNVNLLQ